MRSLGIQGAVRGKAVKTTVNDKATSCPMDRVNRQFQAPRPNVPLARPADGPGVSDFTDVSTRQGFVYTAFVIDAFARRIVGWRVSRTATAGFVLDALEQALCERRPVRRDGLIHHSDRGAQYVSIKYTERLAEAGLEPSVGSVGDSYDNALAETVIGLYKTEVIQKTGPLAQPSSRRACHTGMDRLVQQSPLVRADRQRAAGRGGSCLPRRPKGSRSGGVGLKLTSLRQTRGGSPPRSPGL